MSKRLFTKSLAVSLLQIEGMPDIPDVSGLQKKVDELLSEKKNQSKRNADKLKKLRRRQRKNRLAKMVTSNH
ncbi:hypothetical protein [Providencia hangzhouensis]|uniref:hypothetical protein n=1 Tax=Providencia hangzhouensis TaxID=3031799 RepID=UPI0034DDB2B0